MEDAAAGLSTDDSGSCHSNPTVETTTTEGGSRTKVLEEEEAERNRNALLFLSWLGGESYPKKHGGESSLKKNGGDVEEEEAERNRNALLFLSWLGGESYPKKHGGESSLKKNGGDGLKKHGGEGQRSKDRVEEEIERKKVEEMMQRFVFPLPAGQKKLPEDQPEQEMERKKEDEASREEIGKRAGGEEEENGKRAGGEEGPEEQKRVSSAEEDDRDLVDDKRLKLNREEESRQAERNREEVSSLAESSNRNALLFLSWLLMLAMPVVVWNQPLLVVWRLSLLLCVCSCIWSHLLDGAMSVRALFFSSMFLLALYADAVLDSGMGVLIAHLSSHLAVGMLGYALAERRQRDGTEVSAATAVAGSPSDEKVADKLQFVQTLGALYITLITLGFTARVAWVVLHRADYPTEGLLLHSFLPLSVVIMFWSIYVAGVLLQGAFIEETGVCLVMMYMVSVLLLFVGAIAIVGETGAMIFILHGILTSSGFLGYSLSVYTSFKLRLKVAQP